MAGRQLVSREGLEVLALLCRADFRDGETAAVLVDQVRAAGGIPVLPWGFGKWLGKRGRILEELCNHRDRSFFLGDNGGRPSLLPLARPLRRVVRDGGRLVSGSDPLPLAGEEERVGAYGIRIDADLDPAEPARGLRALLSDDAVACAGYGLPLGTGRFLANQWRVRCCD